MSKQVETISSDTMRALVSWPWPGNVRELRNFIERSVILSRGSTLRAPLVELRADAVQTAGGTLAEIEREYIVRVLQESGGVISAAATRLGVPRTTLNAMMRKLGISCAGFPLIRSDQCEQCRRPMVLFGLERDQLRIVCGVCAAMRTGLSPLAVPAAVIVSLRCKPAI